MVYPDFPWANGYVQSIPVLNTSFPYAQTHRICPRHPRCSLYGKSSGVRLRTESIGISPLPGTPPAAHFCYGSIIVPCVCHRPPRVVTPLHSRYRVDRSLPREITAHLLSLACPLIAYNAGNVPDEWVFSCQSSQGGYLPLQVVASENDCFLRLSRKFFQIFFDSPHSLCDG